MAPIRRNMGKFFERLQLPLVRILRHGRSRLDHLSPARFAGIWLGGESCFAASKLSLHPENEIIVCTRDADDLALFPVRRRRKRTHFHRRPAASPPATWAGWTRTAICSCWAAKRNCWSRQAGSRCIPRVIEQELNNSPDIAHSVIFLKPGRHAPDLRGRPDAAGRRRRRVARDANSPTACLRPKKAAQFVEVIFADEPFTHGKRHAASQPEDRPQGRSRRAISESPPSESVGDRGVRPMRLRLCGTARR